jgi:hypothetical protein
MSFKLARIVLFYILAPLPNLFVGRGGNDDPFADRPSSIKHVAMFLTGGFIISGLGELLSFSSSPYTDTHTLSLSLLHSFLHSTRPLLFHLLALPLVLGHAQIVSQLPSYNSNFC